MAFRSSSVQPVSVVVSWGKPSVSRYLSKNTKLEIGDRIITSDESTMFPKGMLIGTVESIETDSLAREIIAYVKPAADLENANSIMVITEFEAAYE